MKLSAIVVADFRERIRRPGFLIVLGLMVTFAYYCLPPETADYITMSIPGARGVYNSAWIGSMVAMLATLPITLAGFYLVKDAVDRDLKTGVGQIIAATPISRVAYTVGKGLSNFIYLLAFTLAMAGTAAVMQLVRGESPIEWGPLLLPFVMITVPGAALTAGLAVLFETVRWLRGALGHVLFVVLWLAMITVSAAGTVGGTMAPLDPFGLMAVGRSVMEGGSDALGITGGFSLGHVTRTGPLQTFVWNGVDWAGPALLWRMIWLAGGLGLSALAALPFSRFDPALEGNTRRRRRAAAAEEPAEAVAGPVGVTGPVALTPVRGARGFTFPVVLGAELRLMLKGMPWWWYPGALALAVLGLVLPLAHGRGWLLPIAWCWPFLCWGPMGAREVQHRTEQMVLAVPRPLRQQLAACWLAGVLLAVVLGGGVGLRFLLSGDLAGLGAWLVGALFIPALALALGIWTGGSKAFEVLYALLIYVGILNRIPVLDFMGSTQAAVAMGAPLWFLGLTAGLLGLAVLGRRRQFSL